MRLIVDVNKEDYEYFKESGILKANLRRAFNNARPIDHLTHGKLICLIAKKKPLIDTFGNPYMIFDHKWWNRTLEGDNEQTTSKET